MKKIFAAIAVLIFLFTNCSQDQYQTNLLLSETDSEVNLSSLNVKTSSGLQYLAIVEHWNPAGPESFVADLAQKLPKGSGDQRLAFAWVIDAMQTTDTTIDFHIRECFRVAQKFQIPFVLHVNHEWLFPGREIDGDSIVKPEFVEWTDWNRTPLRDWWSDWSVAFEGRPTRFPPRLAFNHPQFLNLNRQKAGVIKNSINKYGGAKSPLFVGIDSGWETGIEYDYQNQLPAYNALIRRGFAADRPPKDLMLELSNISAEMVKNEIDFYKDLVPVEKLFSHILIYDGEKGRRQPTQAASYGGATPGFSVDINSVNMNKVQKLVGSRSWAITESWRGQGAAARTLLGEGLPTNLKAPNLVVLYTWGVDIGNNPNLLTQLASVLNTSTGTTPQTQPPTTTSTPTTTTQTQSNLKPKGSVDIAGPSTIEGWAFDPNEPSKSIEVHVYFNTPPSAGRTPNLKLIANSTNRLDINSHFGITGAHGFKYTIPTTTTIQSIYAYAVDSQDAANMSEAIAWAKPVAPRTTTTTSTPATPTITSCSLGGVTVAVNASRSFYKAQSVPYGSACTAYSRTCLSNGTFSGDASAIFSSCSVQAAPPITTSTATTTPTQPNQKPKGYIDIAGPSTIEGWAFDPNEPSKSIDIHMYFDTAPSAGRIPNVVIKANAANRLDINSHFALTGNHGIYYQIPTMYRGRKVFIFVVDTQDPANMSDAIAWDRQL